MDKTVMVIGFGNMGRSHFNTLRYMQRFEDGIYVNSVVDIDPAKTAWLDRKGVSVYTDTRKAIYEKRPDIVVVTASTAAHRQIIDDILKSKTTRRPALYIESPLAQNGEDAYYIANNLKSAGYGKSRPAAIVYPTRESHALGAVLEYLKSSGKRPESIDVIWQKKRLPDRPTSGVHIDDATHSIDSVVNMILKETAPSGREATITKSEYKREKGIADESLQKMLNEKYETDLLPICEVNFEIVSSGIPIRVSCSYVKEPRERRIRINLDSTGRNTAEVFFDNSSKDIYVLTLDRKIEDYVVSNMQKVTASKLYLGWKTFLGLLSGEKSARIASLDDGVFDVRVAEMLKIAKKRDKLPFKIHDMDWYRIDAFNDISSTRLYIWAHDKDEVKNKYDEFNQGRGLRAPSISRIDPEEAVWLEDNLTKKRHWYIESAKKEVVVYNCRR